MYLEKEKIPFESATFIRDLIFKNRSLSLSKLNEVNGSISKSN